MLTEVCGVELETELLRHHDNPLSLQRGKVWSEYWDTNQELCIRKNRKLGFVEAATLRYWQN